MIEIRKMEERDIGQAANIHRQVLREGLTQDMGYAIEELFKAFIKSSPDTCLVAEVDGTLTGFIVGSVKEWSFGVERSGWIEFVEVDPKYMGQGVGNKLGKNLIDYFKEEGILSVYTSVRWDTGDLIAFFKSLGFDKSEFINLTNKG